MSGNQGTITFDGETKSAREWAEEYDISASTIQTRLAKGWTPFEAITTPPDSAPGPAISCWERPSCYVRGDYVPPVNLAGGYTGW